MIGKPGSLGSTPRRRPGGSRRTPGASGRARPTFAVDWTEPLLYDLVIDTKTMGAMTAVWWGPGPIGGAHVRLAGVLEPETVFRRPIR
jgi:hypothetical protein